MTPSSHHLSAVPAPAPGDSAAIALCVLAVPGEVAGIRKAVGALARRAGLAEGLLSNVALAVGEACANAVVHAYAETRPGVLRVSASATPRGLDVVIADEGRGMAPRPDSPGLGLGLPLMASLTDTLDIRVAPDGGTEIHLGFAATTPGADAPAAWPRSA